MKRLFGNLMAVARKAGSRSLGGNRAARAPRATLGVEALERRELMTVNLTVVPTSPADALSNLFATARVAVEDGVLSIAGSMYGDTVTVSKPLTLNLGGPAPRVSVVDPYNVSVATNGATTTYTFSGLTFNRILFRGHNGDDTFENKTSRPCAAYGDNGNDVLKGGSGADRLYGGKGVDQLRGGGSDDTLVAVDGSTDFVQGDAGNDSFWVDQAACDSLYDASADEWTAGHVHRVTKFADLRQTHAELHGDVLFNVLEVETVSKELNSPDLLDPAPLMSGAAVTHLSDHPLFATAGPTIEDVDQNAIPDCYMLAALAGIADKQPDRIRQAVTDLGDGTYAVRYHRNGQEVYYRIDGDLVTAPNGALVNAGLGLEGSVWVPVLEKAWAFYRNDGKWDTERKNEGTYQLAGYGNSLEVADALNLDYTRTFTNDAKYKTKQDYINDLMSHVNDDEALVINGPGSAGGWSATREERSNAHAWTVVGFAYDGAGKVIGLRVRNPYNGPDDWSGEPYQTFTFDAIYASSMQFVAIKV